MDSSAALGVIGTRGAGKLMQFRVEQLLVQDKAETEELRCRNVHGTENPAELMTKALTGSLITKYTANICIEGKG